MLISKYIIDISWLFATPWWLGIIHKYINPPGEVPLKPRKTSHQHPFLQMLLSPWRWWESFCSLTGFNFRRKTRREGRMLSHLHHLREWCRVNRKHWRPHSHRSFSKRNQGQSRSWVYLETPTQWPDLTLSSLRIALLWTSHLIHPTPNWHHVCFFPSLLSHMFLPVQRQPPYLHRRRFPSTSIQLRTHDPSLWPICCLYLALFWVSPAPDPVNSSLWILHTGPSCWAPHNHPTPVMVKVTPSCLTLCDSMDSTVHGILQARTLEWVAFPFSRGSSQPRDQTQVSRIAGRFFTSWATRGMPQMEGPWAARNFASQSGSYLFQSSRWLF